MDNYFTMANVWGLVWLVLGIVLSLGATMLTAAALLPTLTVRCADRLDRPGSVAVAALLGLGIAVGAAIVTAVLGEIPAIGQPLALLLGSVVFCCAVCGAAGVVLRMARRFSGSDTPGWPPLFRAAAALSFSFLLPLAGTLVILPLTLLCGLGCLVLGLFKRSVSVPALPTVPAGPPPALPTSQQTPLVS